MKLLMRRYALHLGQDIFNNINGINSKNINSHQETNITVIKYNRIEPTQCITNKHN